MIEKYVATEVHLVVKTTHFFSKYTEVNHTHFMRGSSYDKSTIEVITPACKPLNTRESTSISANIVELFVRSYLTGEITCITPLLYNNVNIMED